MAKKKVKERLEGEAPAEGAAIEAPASDVAVLPGLSKHQKFTMERMARASVKGCPFNPRQIDAFAKAKLRKFLEALGLLEPLIFDRVSGYLVSGHQRLDAMDRIEGSPDYSLDFAVVSLTPRQLRKALVGLNSTNLMGEWNLPVLKTIIEDKVVKFDPEDVGWSPVGLEDMFGGSGIALDMFDTAKAPAGVQSATLDLLEAGNRGVAPAADDAAGGDDAPEGGGSEQSDLDRAAQDEYERRRDKIIREKSALATSLTAPGETTDYLIHVVCRDDKDRIARLEELGLPADVRYLDVRTLWNKAAARFGGEGGSSPAAG